MIHYYYKTYRATFDSNLKIQSLNKYLSMLNPFLFYFPDIFPKLKKILLLDDVVMQKDLTCIWSINFVAYVETFHRFDCYLNFTNPNVPKNFEGNNQNDEFFLHKFQHHHLCFPSNLSTKDR
jgi:alpha-1,4-galacturonosyltransferase